MSDASRESSAPQRGWYGMACWNGLSVEQRHRLITVGNLPFGYKPEGECPFPASVAVETQEDDAPGPRFYCRGCAIAYLRRNEETMWDDLATSHSRKAASYREEDRVRSREQWASSE